MKIGWWGCGHLHNSYCGPDGGSNIRLPLMKNLNERGHMIFWDGPESNDYKYDESTLEKLEIQKEAWRYRRAETYVIDNWTPEEIDVALLEVRHSIFEKQVKQQNKLISCCLDKNIPIVLWDQDFQLPEAVNDDFFSNVHVIRPYYKNTPKVQKENQTFFPYFYHDAPISNLTPYYDIVYVGNHYGRSEEMRTILEKLEPYDVDIMISGNWPKRDVELVKEMKYVDWVGSTPHFSTIPLLSLGKMTFHCGKKDYNKMGMIPMRPYEARMARIPCYIWDEVEEAQKLFKNFVFSDSSEMLPVQQHPPYNEDEAPALRHVNEATTQLLNIFSNLMED